MLSELRAHLRSFSREWTSNVAARFLDSYTQTLTPHLARLITRNDGGPYFYRYYPRPETEEDSDIGLFIHKFVGSDPLEEVHCHPWEWAASVIVSGAYVETKYKKLGEEAVSHEGAKRVKLGQRQQRVLAPFDVNVILHDQFHRVELVGGPTQPCWTLFLHGPRRSTWGFASEKDGTYREILTRTFHDKPQPAIGVNVTRDSQAVRR